MLILLPWEDGGYLDPTGGRIRKGEQAQSENIQKTLISSYHPESGISIDFLPVLHSVFEGDVVLGRMSVCIGIWVGRMTGAAR